MITLKDLKKELKKCENSKGYIGVNDDLHYNNEKENIQLLFHYVDCEIMYLKENAWELTPKNPNMVNKADADFKTEYHVNLHIKRLEKFLAKYKEMGINKET